MRYAEVCEAVFVDRPNRFVAHVQLNKKIETVHVKNTGRCRELLLPGSRVILSQSDNPARKTAYDLIAVEKRGFGLINMDSQAPNCVVHEWLRKQSFDVIRPEYTYGDSRFDFYIEGNGVKYLLEVKGCTLEKDGVGYFPDAPTARGRKHLMGLKAAVAEGYLCAVAFVVQMENVTRVLPNTETDPLFAAALREAEAAGVKVIALPCAVTENTLEIIARDGLEAMLERHGRT